jgi:hypothetical protein
MSVRRDDTRWPTVAAVGVLAVYNLAQNRWLDERGYVCGNLVVSGLLVQLGRTSGLGWDEMGLVLGDVNGARRIGALGLATALVGLSAVGSRQRWRVLLRDERVAADSVREAMRKVLIRFPLGTALFEEVAFRGVLSALLRRSRTPVMAEAMSAIAFGLWHMIPTLSTLDANPAGRNQGPAKRIGIITTGCVAAGVGGLVFSSLRKKTGSLLAPWFVHSSFNCLTYLAARAAR